MNRRRYLTGVAAAGLVSTAGCLEEFLEDATTFAATPATVSDGMEEEAGYSHEETRSFEESEDVAGETVEVTNHITEYTRTIDVPGFDDLEAGVFSVITSPQVSVADRQFNPLSEMDSEEIVALVQDQYEEISIEGAAGDRSVDGLEKSIDVEGYEGSATLVTGVDMDILLDIAQPDYGDDHFVIVGVYPADVPDEEERIDTMIAGLEHEDD